MKNGFSLVELSIVLVILGLLVGGILAGQSLIRAAELRSVSTEYQRYTTAVYAFRDKYFMLPGDMNNAEAVWGQADAVAANCYAFSSANALTCNGDGDGMIETVSTRSFEIYRAWQHLANAGLIEGTFSGTRGTVGWPWSAVSGTNVPRSKMSQAGWAWVSRQEATATGGFYASMFYPTTEHWLEYGQPSGNSYAHTPILKAEEGWNIDTKLDDGKPGTGKVTTYMNSYISTCASSDTAATAIYRLDQTVAGCIMLMGI